MGNTRKQSNTPLWLFLFHFFILFGVGHGGIGPLGLLLLVPTLLTSETEVEKGLNIIALISGISGYILLVVAQFSRKNSISHNCLTASLFLLIIHLVVIGFLEDRTYGFVILWWTAIPFFAMAMITSIRLLKRYWNRVKEK